METGCFPYPKNIGRLIKPVMGKKSVRLDEEIHDEIEQMQKEFMRLTGEDPPSKEKVIQKGLENKREDKLLEDLFKEKKKDKVSEFDKLFGL